MAGKPEERRKRTLCSEFSTTSTRERRKYRSLYSDAPQGLHRPSSPATLPDGAQQQPDPEVVVLEERDEDIGGFGARVFPSASAASILTSGSSSVIA
jgi:hypothetical protein